MKTKLFRLLGVGLVIFTIAPSAALATSNATSPDIPEIRIISQPFNITTSTNARFVLDPNLDALVDRSDRLEFQLHRRVASVDSFRGIANGEVQLSVTDSMTLRLSQIRRDYAGHLLPIVPIITEEEKNVALSIPFDGIYPITIRIVDSGTEAVLSEVLTFLNKRGPEVPAIAVPFSSLVHLQSEPSFDSNGDIQISDETRASIQRLVDFLIKHPKPVTIAIEPEILAALAESALPTDARLFLALQEQLRTRSLTVAAFAPTDPSSFASLGLGAEFTAQLSFGEKTLTRLLPGVTVQKSTYVARHRLDDDGLALLRASGIDTILLLPEAMKDVNGEKAPFLLAHPNGSGSETTAIMTTLSTLISPKVRGSKKDAYRIAAEVLIERDDLLASGNDASAIRIVLPIDLSNATTSTSVTLAARTLAATPGIDDRDFSMPQSIDTNTPTIAFGAAIPARGASLVSNIKAARNELAAIGSMLAEGDPRRRSWPALLALGTSASVDNPSEYLLSLRTRLRETRAAVTVTTPTKLTLSSRNGAIRLQIRNNSADDLIVRVRLSSAKLTFTDPSRIVTLTAGGTTEVIVSAVTRTSGSFPVSVWVATPIGNMEVVPLIIITANVTAIAGFGQLISISLLLVILAWWWSNRRSARHDSDKPTTVSH